ncbi:MAG: copper homeostasis protein CutC [Bacteroidales bacterium]|jgi:copper homeostasis protein|nr:copper homeostasis protein CutC [Bacteroidales bacterium]
MIRIEALTVSIDSVRRATSAGVNRVELCDNLPEGGTTPSGGMIRAAVEIAGSAVMVMIRPRPGDFLYSQAEISCMEEDIHLSKKYGAAGIVFGCLTPQGMPDDELCRHFVKLAGPLDITFHRAFDMVERPDEALEMLIDCGIHRVLTSGGKKDAESGIEQIAALQSQAKGRISIMAGGGIKEHNVLKIIQSTGIQEIHINIRKEIPSQMQFRNENVKMGQFTTTEYIHSTSDEDGLRRIIDLCHSL